MSRVTVYNDSQCSRVRVSYPTSVIITNVCVHGVNKHLHDVKANVMPSFHCLSPCSYVLEGYFIQEELKTITISVYRCELTSNGQRQHFSSTKIKECKINDRGKINDAAGLCKEEDCIHSPAFTNWLASGCVINAEGKCDNELLVKSFERLHGHGCWRLLSFTSCSRCLQLDCQTDRRAAGLKLQSAANLLSVNIRWRVSLPEAELSPSAAEIMMDVKALSLT